MWRERLGLALLCSCLLTPAVADDPKRLTLSGALAAREAERFSVPLTDTWQIQLKWLVEEGVTVETGDPIARFDSSGLEVQLAETEDRLADSLQQRSLEESEGRLQRMNLELELKRAEVGFKKASIDASVPHDTLKGVDFRERQYKLREADKRLGDARISIETHDSAEMSKLASRDIEIAQTRERIQRYKKDLDRLVLRATGPGIVVHEVHPWFGRKVREGDQLQATFPVASIPDLSTLEVEGWATEIDLTEVNEGQAAIVLLDAYPGKEFRGHVVEIGRGGEQRDQWGRAPYFRIRIELDARDPALMKPGMSVRCELLADESIRLASGGDGR